MIWALQLNLDQSGKLVQQSLGETVHFGSSKPTQSPKTNRDRSGKPVAQEIVVGVLQEETKFFRQTRETCVEGRTTCPKSRQLRET